MRILVASGVLALVPKYFKLGVLNAKTYSRKIVPFLHHFFNLSVGNGSEVMLL